MNLAPFTVDETTPARLALPSNQQGEASSSSFSRILVRQLGGADPGSARDSQMVKDRTERSNDSVRGDSTGVDTEDRNVAGKKEPAAKPTAQGREAGMESLEVRLGLPGTWSAVALPPAGLHQEISLITAFAGSHGGSNDSVGIPTGLANQIAARYESHGGVQTVTLRLDPAHLGKVEVTMQAKGDHLSVRLTAGNKEAETALRNNLKELSEAIQNRTGRFSQVDIRVDVKSDQANEDRPGSGRQGHSEDREGRGQGGSRQGNTGRDPSEHEWTGSEHRSQGG